MNKKNLYFTAADALIELSIFQMFLFIYFYTEKLRQYKIFLLLVGF